MRLIFSNRTLRALQSTLFLFLTLHAGAVNLFVSNSGSDQNSGSISSPYLTIQTALNVAVAGDNIYIRGGTYAEKIWWPVSGTPGNPITLSNYNGENVVLSGINPSNASQGAFIVLSSKSYIRINGLTFKDNIMNYAEGVYALGSGTDVHITNCEFDNIGWTNNKSTFPAPFNSAHAIIFVGSSSTSYNNIYIGSNHVHDCITGYSESITLVGNVEVFLIEGNTLNSNTNIGIDVAGHFPWTGAPANVNYARSGIIKNNVVSNYAGPAGLDAAAGIYSDGASYITVENNEVHDYKVGYSFGCEVAGHNSYGNILRNNVAHDCSQSGLFLGSNTSSSVNNAQVYNNTFYHCGTAFYDNGQMALLNNAACDIRNNIFYPTNGRWAIVQMTGTTSTTASIAYNLFWRDNGTTSNLFFNVSASNSVLGDPLFTNVAANDFHISSSSLAVNAGDPNYSGSGALDMDGEIRVQGGRVDIGSDEITSTAIRESNSGGSGMLINVGSATIGVFPNPVSEIINVTGLEEGELVQIHGVMGNFLFETADRQINVAHLEPGNYFIKTANEKAIRFIKQ